jgi:hypothetical protein
MIRDILRDKRKVEQVNKAAFHALDIDGSGSIERE